MAEFDKLREMAEKVARADQAHEDAIDAERSEKRRVLAELLRAAAPAMESLATPVHPRFPPASREDFERRGLLVDARRNGSKSHEWLFVSDAGAFFGASVRGVADERKITRTSSPMVEWESYDATFADLTLDEVIDARWGVNAMAARLAEAMKSQLAGLEKATTKSEAIGRVLRAVADLLSEIR